MSKSKAVIAEIAASLLLWVVVGIVAVFKLVFGE